MRLSVWWWISGWVWWSVNLDEIFSLGALVVSDNIDVTVLVESDSGLIADLCIFHSPVMGLTKLCSLKSAILIIQSILPQEMPRIKR